MSLFSRTIYPIKTRQKMNQIYHELVTKSDLKKATDVNVSEFAKKTDLNTLNSDVDILDNDE